jgi:hypothetical protein
MEIEKIPDHEEQKINLKYCRDLIVATLEVRDERPKPHNKIKVTQGQVNLVYNLYTQTQKAFRKMKKSGVPVGNNEWSRLLIDHIYFNKEKIKKTFHLGEVKRKGAIDAEKPC